MSFQEKRSLSSLIATMVGYGLYFWYVYQRYEGQTFEPMEEIRFWGKAVIILVPVQVVFLIIVHILLAIFSAIVSQEQDPGLMDERDKLIDLKATRICLNAFMAGFFAAMVTVILGMSIQVMFSVILGSFLLSGMALYLSQFYFYRRGF